MSTSEPAPSPTKKPSSRYSMLTSSIPKLSSPFKSRGLGKPRTSMSPGSSPGSAASWNAGVVFERDIKARGFAHKTWRVREMALEWLSSCVSEHTEFPAAHYIANAFSLLDDNQEAVRFAARRALNTIYRHRPELQQDIVSKAQAISSQKPTLLTSITAPEGELAALPSSPSMAGRSGSRQAASGFGMRPGSRVTGARPGSRTTGIPSRSELGSAARGISNAARPGATGNARPGSRVNQAAYGMQSGLHAGGPPRAYGNRSGSRQEYRSESRTGSIGRSSALSPGRVGSGGSSQYQHNLASLHSQVGVHGLGTSPASAHSAMSSSSATSISKPSPGYLSSLGQQRHSAGSRASNSLTKRPSMVRITEQFVPSRNVPADVKPRNMASAQMLGREMSEVMPFFDGRESEANWVQRERAVVLFRAIIWGNSAIEFCSELVAMFREHIHEIVKAVNSLRTSLSGHGMRLCEDIAMRLGPHASPLFDPIVGALLKQCAQTKKIAAQAAASAMAVVFQHFPLRAKAIETLRYYIADKSPVLRLAVVTTCTCVLRSHATVLQHSPGDRRSTEVFAHISVVAKQGVMDAQPSVREPSRELFWEFYNVSALNARKLLASLPASTQAMLNRDKDRYVKGAQDAASVDRPMSAASVVRMPSAQQFRAHSPPAAQSLSQEPPMPSLMNVVSGYSVPQNATLFPQQINDHSLLSADAQLGSRPEFKFVQRGRTVSKVVEDEHEDDDGDMVMYDATDERPLDKFDVHDIRGNKNSRQSLGLLDFSSMDVGAYLMDVEAPPVQSKAHGLQTGATTAVAASQEDPDLSNLNLEENQATGLLSGPSRMSLDSNHSQAPEQTGSDVKQTREHIPTPDSTPLLPPSPPSETRQHQQNPFITPRTQTARYWNGPLQAPVMPSIFKTPLPQPVDSPMPAATPNRLLKIERYLQRLANDDIDDALFRSLARYAKEEPSSVWMPESAGGHGILTKLLNACVEYLRNPAESRDTVFIKDNCFDVLRMIVRKQWQYFTLDAARTLLLEVLRSKYSVSPIVSGSAEDVYYDIAAHLDIDMCLALFEDFFLRAPMPAFHIQAAYAELLPPQVETPAAMDPLGVLKMENSLAGVLDLVADVVKRLSSPTEVTNEVLQRFMPYAMACLGHPRSQVRKAALAPVIAVHQKLAAPDQELAELLQATAEQLSASANPMAPYIAMLQRPELKKLIWTFFLSDRS
ncbi:suppressor of tub2 mutation [Linderina pennispora]|nr:suppressor of tub2 mutation [Linderina pennispora]